jgi:diketogulonate reductase-like aldo/keto reductase
VRPARSNAWTLPRTLRRSCGGQPRTKEYEHGDARYASLHEDPTQQRIWRHARGRALATKQATKTALEVGFRHFDCAERYRNEEAIGAPLGHGLDPKVLDDPVITAIAQRVHKTPAQVALAWAVQRGTAFLVTSRTASRIQENFDISSLPEDAMREIRHGITMNVRRNPVAETGVPGFIPRAR